MDYDSDIIEEEQHTTHKQHHQPSLFDDDQYDYNWEFFSEMLEDTKNKVLETEYTGLFEKCSVADFLKFIDNPKTFNVLHERHNLPRKLKPDRLMKMPYPRIDGKKVQEKLNELRRKY